MKIGFIGLGTMGRPMAANLLKAGHALFAHDHKPVPEALFAQGAIACGSGEEVARQADVVITMVPDTPHVASALFDPGGVAAGLSPGKIGVSLPNTATAQELFNACAAHGGKAWDHSAMVRALELLAGHDIAGNGDGKT